MKAILKTIRENPALFAGLLGAVLNAAVLFGVSITAAQIGGLNAIYAAVAALFVHTRSASIAGLNAWSDAVASAPAPPAASGEVARAAARRRVTKKVGRDSGRAGPGTTA